MALELFVNDNNNGIEMSVDSNIQDLSLGQTVVKEAVKELYKCIYEETTFDQITEAIASGKFPYLVNGSSTYWLVEDYADYIGEYDFEFTDKMGDVHFACCTGEGWQSGTVTPLFAYQKVTELNDQSTDNEVPSAKCVYDELNEKQNTLNFDTTPTENSTNPVTSGGIYDAIASKTDAVVFKGDANVGTLPTVITLREGKTPKDVKKAIDEYKDVYIEFTPRDSENPIIFRFSGSVRETTSADEYSVVYQFVSTHDAPLYTVIPTMASTDNYIAELTYKKYMLGTMPVEMSGLSLNKSTVESTKNKVTQISVSSTDIEYPSAKCVYDALGTKQNTLTFDSTPTENSTNPVTSDGIYNAILNAVPEDEIFWATYQVTSYNDVLSNYNAGKLVAMKESTYIYFVTCKVPTAIWFTSLSAGDTTHAYELKSTNQWVYHTHIIPSKTSDLQNDSGFITSASLPTKTSDLINDGADDTSVYVEANDLATVAISGAYSDLTGQPTDLSDFNNDVGFITSAPVSSVDGKTGAVTVLPGGGNAGQVLKKNSATDYDVHWADQTQYYPSGYSTTGADKQTKQIACSSWTATAKSYLHILLTHANTYAGKIYFTVNAVNTYEVWINGAVSSATNYSLPAGTYIIYFDGSAFQVRTDGIIPASINGTAARIPYGECDNTSTSTAFTATVPGITELKDGVTMLLYNGVVTSASGFTIDINGLGAKPSYSNMALGNPITPTNPTRDTTIFNINYAFLFVYSETLVSGGCWIGYRGYDANTNTIGYQLRTNQTTMKTADKFYRYRLLFTSADGTQWIPANTSTSTNATAVRTPNTRAIDPFGEIVWYGTTTAIEANANVTAAQLWQEYYGSYTNIGYSFNNTGAAQTMTANLPIYIKCTPQVDGSAIIDPTTPYTQTLPSTDDGKIYIYLGRAYNATNFELVMNHPVYYHDGTGIRIWCGGRLMPNPPSTDGTYTLQCTVSNGTVTYNWI